MNRWWMLLPAAGLGLALGMGAAWLARDQAPAIPPEVESGGAGVGDSRPDFRHAGLEGAYVEAADFDDQLLLVNFWATWCAPCIREMPLLQEAYEAHANRLAVVGIAIDDPGEVPPFVEDLGISYPILVGGPEVMKTNREWGNASGALPYTVLVDRDGVIRWQHLGEVTAEELEAVLREWL